MKEQTSLDRVIEGLHLGDRFEFHVVTCVDTRHVRWARRQLRAALGEAVVDAEILLRDLSQPRRLVDRLLQQTPRGIMVLGATVMESQVDRWALVFQRLNEARNHLMGCFDGLVLLLPARLKSVFALYAQDFFSARSSSVVLEPLSEVGEQDEGEAEDEEAFASIALEEDVRDEPDVFEDDYERAQDGLLERDVLSELSRGDADDDEDPWSPEPEQLAGESRLAVEAEAEPEPVPEPRATPRPKPKPRVLPSSVPRGQRPAQQSIVTTRDAGYELGDEVDSDEAETSSEWALADKARRRSSPTKKAKQTVAPAKASMVAKPPAGRPSAGKPVAPAKPSVKAAAPARSPAPPARPMAQPSPAPPPVAAAAVPERARQLDAPSMSSGPSPGAPPAPMSAPPEPMAAPSPTPGPPRRKGVIEWIRRWARRGGRGLDPHKRPLHVLLLSSLLVTDKTKGRTLVEERMRSMMNDLEAQSCPPFDLVVVAGDVASRGVHAEMEHARMVLRQLPKHLGPVESPPPLIVVPGNHDMGKALPTWRRAVALGTELDDAMNLRNNLALAKEGGRGCRWLVQSLYEDGVVPAAPVFEPYLLQSHELVHEGRRVAVRGFDSAWGLPWVGPDRGVLGSQQLEAALSGLEDADCRIAVVHHPPDMMDPSEWAVIRRSFDLVLTGAGTSLVPVQRTPDRAVLVAGPGLSGKWPTHGPAGYAMVSLSARAQVKLRWLDAQRQPVDETLPFGPR